MLCRTLSQLRLRSLCCIALLTGAFTFGRDSTAAQKPVLFDHSQAGMQAVVRPHSSSLAPSHDAETQRHFASVATPPNCPASSDDGGQTKGEPCDPDHRCAKGLGCSGLYVDASGICITAAEAKIACETPDAEQHVRGVWGKWGLLELAFCNRRQPDANIRCNTSDECLGKCISLKDERPHCQEFELQYGCYRVYEADSQTPLTLCVD